jgi:hypothetical protein
MQSQGPTNSSSASDPWETQLVCRMWAAAAGRKLSPLNGVPQTQRCRGIISVSRQLMAWWTSVAQHRHALFDPGNFTGHV